MKQQAILVIGLGKMGFNFARNLLKQNYLVYGYDINSEICAQAQMEGIKTNVNLNQIIAQMPQPRIVLLSLQQGLITYNMVVKLANELLEAGDVVLDTANGFYQDSQKNYQLLKQKNIAYLDVGTSGGPHGALTGACMMVGGDFVIFEQCQPILKDLCITNGCLYTGNSGSGHFVKMIHNGIEYGMMQALAEGFQVLHESEFQPNNQQLSAIAQLWNHGSVIRSWLVELCAQAFVAPDFPKIKGIVQATGEGLWTVQTALTQGTPVPVIAAALMARQTSQKEELFANKTLAKLRQLFGGHAVNKK